MGVLLYINDESNCTFQYLYVCMYMYMYINIVICIHIHIYEYTHLTTYTHIHYVLDFYIQIVANTMELIIDKPQESTNVLCSNYDKVC